MKLQMKRHWGSLIVSPNEKDAGSVTEWARKPDSVTVLPKNWRPAAGAEN
jgi:hypothetical protein